MKAECVGEIVPRLDRIREIVPRLDRIRVLMAGAEAERVCFGDAWGGGSDDKRVADLLRDGEDESRLRDGVRRLLADNQGTLRWLANKLARCGALSGREVARIIRMR